MSEIEPLPEAAITVETVSIPVVVVSQQPVTVDLRPSTRVGGVSAHIAAPVPHSGHVAVTGEPVLSRLTVGHGLWWLIMGASVAGVLTLGAALLAWLGGWI